MITSEHIDYLSKADNINIARSYGPYSREKTGWSRIS